MTNGHGAVMNRLMSHKDVYEVKHIAACLGHAPDGKQTRQLMRARGISCGSGKCYESTFDEAWKAIETLQGPAQSAEGVAA